MQSPGYQTVSECIVPDRQVITRMVKLLQPRYVLGVGKFARDRAAEALAGFDLVLGGVTHPSPANPKANRGWKQLVTEELAAAGIDIER